MSCGQDDLPHRLSPITTTTKSPKFKLEQGVQKKMLGPEEFRKINDVFVFALIVCGVVFGGFLMVFVGMVVGMITGWCVKNRRVPPPPLPNHQRNK